MAEETPDYYLERLKKNDIVYLVTGGGSGDNPDNPPVVQKATVTHTHNANGLRRHYPYLILWDSPFKDPTSTTQVARSPHKLFTSDEVQQIAVHAKLGPITDQRPLDALIEDPITSPVLAAALGAAAIARLAQDELPADITGRIDPPA